MKLRLSFALAVLCLAVAPMVPAQDNTLILEKKPEVKVRTKPAPGKPGDKGKGTDGKGAGTNAKPEATPAPEDVFIAIVDGRVLTKAELDMRVLSQLERIKRDIMSSTGGVIAQLDAGLNPVKAEDLEADEQQEVLLEQQRAVERATREEVGRVIQSWVNQSLLAEEARRQGVTIEEGDFRARLVQAEKESNLDKKTVQGVLDRMKMSHQDYEKTVYDALMIERLVDRFIKVNYTDEQLRRAYQINPSNFYEPPKYRIAHFTITLEGNEDKKTLSSMRQKAESVAQLLRSGKDPEQVFAKAEFNALEFGIYGAIPGWFTFNDGLLPPAVEAEGRKMKVGQTSSVIVQQQKEDDKIVPVSYHVIKILDSVDATGDTYESALPAIRRSLIQVAKETLTDRLVAAKTHRIIVNVGGIPPAKVPTREQVIKMEASAEKINLKLDDASLEAARKVRGEG